MRKVLFISALFFLLSIHFVAPLAINGEYVDNYCAQVGGYELYSGIKINEGYGVSSDALSRCFAPLDDGEILTVSEAQQLNCEDYVCALVKGIEEGALTYRTVDKKCAQEEGISSSLYSHCQGWCPQGQVHNGTACIENDICIPLRSTGEDTADTLNIVFVPSNFEGNMTLFAQKADEIWSHFETYKPFGRDVNHIQAFYVAEDNGDFCELGCYGIPRLLCCDTAKAKNISATCTNQDRQTIVVQNDGTYGGAGYNDEAVATTTTHDEAPSIAVHEIGHSLFNLGDEYASSINIDNPVVRPNCDYSTCSKWSNMLGYSGVDCRPNGCYQGNYYTSEISIMRVLSARFEEVNLRSTCCTIKEHTGEYPSYCAEFNQFSPSNDLDNFCLNNLKSKDKTILYQPVKLYLTLDDGQWKVQESIPLKAGYYYQDELTGFGSSTLEIVFHDGRTQRFSYRETYAIEFPQTNYEIGEAHMVPRTTLNVLTPNTSGVKSITRV